MHRFKYKGNKETQNKKEPFSVRAKNRREVWLENAKPIEGKHELLLNDGITTGAPLEACYEEF